MGSELQVRNVWAEPGSRKRHAARAALEGDERALLGLLEHHCRLKSRPRALIASGTLESYAQGVRALLGWIGPASSPRHHLARLDEEALEAWVAHLQTRLAPGTVALRLCGARALFRALNWAGAMSHNPARDVRAPKDPTPAHERRGAMTPEVYAALLEQPSVLYPKADPRVTRDALIIALGGSAGLRASEITALDVNDVSLRHGTLTVRRGKGGKRRSVPITRALEGRITAWIGTRRRLVRAGRVSQVQTALLVSLSTRNHGSRLARHSLHAILARYADRLELPPHLRGTHTLRRTAGTHLYRATRDLHIVADVLGHAKLDTAALYAKLDFHSRREALEQMEDYRKAHTGTVQALTGKSQHRVARGF